MTVDAERLVSSYLRDRSEITDIVGDRVYTDMPKLAVFPLVRITLLGGSPRYSYPLWLDEAFLQLDAYGGPKALARQLVDHLREALVDTEFAVRHTAGVITGVRFGELMYLPDDLYDPPKPRYVAEVSVFSHP